jgi:hypothetical protein
MNCAQFRERVQSVARDEALDSATLSAALAHAESCPACDSLLEEADSLTSALHSLAELHASEQAPAQTEAILLAAFRERQAARPTRSEAHAKKFRYVSVAAAMGIAAAVLLVIFVARTANRFAGKSPASAPTPAQTVPARTGAPRPSQVLSADASPDDSDAGFVPLPASPYSEASLSGDFDPASVEDGTVVRVMLSPSALAALGFPMADDPGAQDVAADLLLAQDGTPQAIRLLDTADSNQAAAIRSELQ